MFTVTPNACKNDQSDSVRCIFPLQSGMWVITILEQSRFGILVEEFVVRVAESKKSGLEARK